MTKDEINRMAKDAGWIIRDDLHYMDHQAMQDALIQRIERFAELVADHEREACAKVCESLEEQCEKLSVPDEKWPTPADCANAIRARK